jgi:hypothetical protein
MICHAALAGATAMISAVLFGIDRTNLDRWQKKCDAIRLLISGRPAAPSEVPHPSALLAFEISGQRV